MNDPIADAVREVILRYTPESYPDAAMADARERMIEETSQAVREALWDSAMSESASLRERPSERRLRWRTEMQSALNKSGRSGSFALVVDDIATAAMRVSDYEKAAVMATFDKASHNKWFTEGADFSPIPENASATTPQAWGKLINMDPDLRMQWFEAIWEAWLEHNHRFLQDRVEARDGSAVWVPMDEEETKWMLLKPVENAMVALDYYSQYIARVYPEIEVHRAFHNGVSITMRAAVEEVNRDAEEGTE